MSQVTFTESPQDLQLYGRDLISNSGHVLFQGEVNNSLTNFDSIQIKVYREAILIDSFSNFLIYTGGLAPFDFDIEIPAELANYSFEVSGLTLTSDSLIRTTNNVVAGDVFIIQGQSNAEAQRRTGSLSVVPYEGEFMRVFASAIEDTTYLKSNNTWYYGQGDSSNSTNGNMGQWGVALARGIIDSTGIPVAFFNGARGATSISFFQASVGYQYDLNSNYARLYYRLNESGLKNFVRAVYWSQGETDGSDFFMTSVAEYKSEFMNLQNAWLNDYPNIEQFYIFQSKNGCGDSPINLMPIKEAQRQLAFENANIQIIPTAQALSNVDQCHFSFQNGYAFFAYRSLLMTYRDLYGWTPSSEIDAPMILLAYLTNDTSLVLLMDADTLIMDSLANDFYLENADIYTQIDSIHVFDDKIIMDLNKFPGENVSISYWAQELDTGLFIKNASGIELICFYKFPVQQLSAEPEEIELVSVFENFDSKVEVYPNPAKSLVYFNQLYDEDEIVSIRLLTMSGEVLFEGPFLSGDCTMDVSNYPAGIYLLYFEFGTEVVLKKLVILNEN